jgi:putative ABC transport system permease protein
MFENYLKTAFRNLLRHKTFSAINILGLTGGLTCCLLIFVFVADELSYDNFHSKKDRIYRVHYMIQNFDIARIPPVMTGHFASFFPEIEKAGRMWTRNVSIQIPNDATQSPARFEETNVYFADSTILDIFSFEEVEGSIVNTLREPYTVILNQETAQKYFPNQSALGKLITMEGEKIFRVVAVVKDFPSNSHIHFNMLVPYENMYDIEQPSLQQAIRDNFKMNWMVSHSHSYVLLKEGTDPTMVDARFPEFVKEKIPESMQKDQSFELQALSDIHLNSDIQSGAEPTGSLTFLYIFIAVGILTLLIASINFINLSTARSLQRAKEIGMRKVLGAWKSNLIFQFLGESFVTTALAAVLAVVATFLLLPQLNDLTGKVLGLDSLFTPISILGFIGLFLFTGLLAGIYPAFFVTRISPVNSLKGQVSKENSAGLSFRKVLIIVQFTISMLLISSTLIVFDQLDYLKSKPLGFQKDHIINVPIQSQNFNNIFGGVDGDLRRKMNAFEAKLESVPGVIASTASANAPGFGVVNRNIIPEGFTAEDNMLAPVYSVDYDFINTYSIEMKTGREFSKEFGTDHQNAFIINEYAVKDYNFEDAEMALGKNINCQGKEGKVVGVVKDFNFLPLSQPMGALVMEISTAQFNVFSIKIDNKNIPKTLDEIEGVWNEMFTTETFSHTFLDEQIEQTYAAQDQLGNVVSYFSILAILISCLGSYGLIMFIANQKMKEVGIRKVLGASVAGLVFLLSKRFLILAFVAMIISIPLAYLASDNWLDNFSYRIDISPMSFVISCAVTVLLVLITVSFQSIKTALANPIKALRTE